MDNGHILALTGAELDAALARAQNALPRDGSAPMTGAMRIFENRGVVNTEYGESVTMTYLRSIFGDRAYSLEVGNFGPRYFEGVVDNPWSNERLILHTGNKPSGTYTGNGSADWQEIDVGGFGNAALITSGNGIALLTSAAGFAFEFETGAIRYVGGYYSGGKIITATVDKVVNSNGATYSYQVL